MSYFVKHYSDPAKAEEAARRTVAVQAEGVSTPAVLGAQSPASLSFQFVKGQTGHDLGRTNLAPLLSVVARLHNAAVPDLPKYDPALRIRPRLSVPTKLPVDDLLSEPVPVGHATLHGDLHVGQFICDQSKKVWIVDLDDLAIGPPEADLANFAAHLATSFPSASICEWSDRVCTAWDELGESMDRGVFSRFMRLALLRRHLKLREAGRPNFEADILTYLRESSNFSIL